MVVLVPSCVENGELSSITVGAMLLRVESRVVLIVKVLVVLVVLVVRVVLVVWVVDVLVCVALVVVWDVTLLVSNVGSGVSGGSVVSVDEEDPNTGTSKGGGNGVG